MADQYDILIIGGGQAGIPLAKSLAKAGRKVALAERLHLGGSCINFGCTPTKAALASARVAQAARHAKAFGVKIPSVEVDFPAVLQRAGEMAESSRDALRLSLDGLDNLRLIEGHARFIGKAGNDFRLTVDQLEINARQVVLDTGTRSHRPETQGLDRISVIDSGNWLDHRQLPQSLAMLGGGPIGLEMAQFYRRMGSAVTVVVQGDQVLSHEDPDVAQAVQRALEGEGIEFRLNTLARCEKISKGVAVMLDHPGKWERLEVSEVFLAQGRKPNTDDLGLDKLGVRMDERGFVKVDHHLATNVPGIWAAGDIRGGPMFTHAAWDDFRILESQLLGDESFTTRNRIVPYAVFTDPELGRVGMTEAEARQKHSNVRIGRFEIANNSKARELGETQGFVKVVADGDSGNLLGAAVFSSGAAELVHLYLGMMNADIPYSVMARAIHIHPTLAEALQSAVAAL